MGGPPAPGKVVAGGIGAAVTGLAEGTVIIGGVEVYVSGAVVPVAGVVTGFVTGAVG